MPPKAPPEQILPPTEEVLFNCFIFARAAQRFKEILYPDQDPESVYLIPGGFAGFNNPELAKNSRILKSKFDKMAEKNQISRKDLIQGKFAELEDDIDKNDELKKALNKISEMFMDFEDPEQRHILQNVAIAYRHFSQVVEVLLNKIEAQELSDKLRQIEIEGDAQDSVWNFRSLKQALNEIANGLGKKEKLPKRSLSPDSDGDESPKAKRARIDKGDEVGAGKNPSPQVGLSRKRSSSPDAEQRLEKRQRTEGGNGLGG